MYFDTNNKADCCGCTACMNACPTSAIRMKEDVEGFQYPAIDEEACIHCNLCRNVCCWENASYNNASEPVTLASVLKNKEERQKSTSGGTFYALAQWVIKNKGVVYGAAFDEQLQLHHYGAQTLDELQKLRGSKYIQSYLGNIFKEIKSQLSQDRWCLFSGTGCQVAGLKAFLRKDYQKLITVDLVCHGVPSQKLFNEHISYIENKYSDKIVYYQFRDNKSGIGCEICEFKKRRKLKRPTYELSPYLYGFMYGITLRYSCYECRFAHIPRQGDITLADYWGVGKVIPKIDRTNGVSLTLLNTPKAKTIWDKVDNNLLYYYSNIEDATRCNGNLIHSTLKPEIRDVVFEELEKLGYSYVAEKYFRSSNYKKILLKSMLTPFLRPLFCVYRKVKNIFNCKV